MPVVKTAEVTLDTVDQSLIATDLTNEFSDDSVVELTLRQETRMPRDKRRPTSRILNTEIQSDADNLPVTLELTAAASHTADIADPPRDSDRR